MRRRHGNPETGECCFDTALRLRIGKREKQRNRYCLSTTVAYRVSECAERRIVRRDQNFALGAHAFRNAKAQLTRDKANRQRSKPVVERAAGLASNGNGVLEAGSSDKGNTRSAPLEHRVRAQRGAVPQIGGAISGDPRECVENRQRRIRWRREKLEHAQLPGLEVNAVGEGAAGIDGRAQRAVLSYPGMTAATIVAPYS